MMARTTRARLAHAGRGAGLWLVCAAVGTLAVIGPTAAMENGMIGYSGKDLFTCTQCHSDGVRPTVRFDGPAEVQAGEAVPYSFIVQSRSQNQLYAGLDVAASDGTLEVAPTEDDGQIESGELTHLTPKKVDENLVATWSFIWQAPATPGTATLYGAGLSANGNGTTSGDQPASTRLVITVTPAPPPGDANCDGRLSAADVVGIAALITGAAANTCDLADADCSGTVDADDIPVVIASLFDPAIHPPCP